ncbi:MAG: ABC transporter substrate-binding protein [Ilumatobacteraceae bacterium]
MGIRFRPLIGSLLVAATVLAACGGDDDDADTTEGAAATTAAPEPTDGAPTTEAEASETTEPSTTEGETPATTAAAELTDSYRGVTADSIKVGVLLLDLVKLKESAGVELKWGDNEGQYREAIATINENGGVLGRQIDPVFVYVDPLSETGYQEACVQLTEDEEVFAVIGFLRPASGALCYTGTGDTPFVGYLSDITSDVFEQSVLPTITSNPLPERLDVALVDVVAESGALEGKTIAILGRTDERNKVVTDALTAHGFEVTDAVLTNQPTDDPVADAAELDVVIERWSSLGVDYVIDTTGIDRPLAAANRAGFEAEFATNVGSILSLSRFESGATEAEVARSVVVQEPQVELIYESGHEATVACVDNWNEKRPDEPAVFFPGEDDIDNLQRIARSCNQIQTFKLIAETAGPDLTTESWAEAVANVGSYDVAMQPFASLSADKWDAGDLVALYTWDAEAQDYKAGDFIDIG